MQAGAVKPSRSHFEPTCGVLVVHDVEGLTTPLKPCLGGAIRAPTFLSKVCRPQSVAQPNMRPKRQETLKYGSLQGFFPCFEALGFPGSRDRHVIATSRSGD